MKHIAVAGNIGAGKTTLAQRLAGHFGWEVSFESVEDNPYLADFYEDMPRWAFHLQIYFLNNRFAQVQQVRLGSVPTIQDRTIYEDAHIFARNLVESGLMPTRDYENYWKVYSSMLQYVHAPDLLIYLRADVEKLQNQIRKRGREFEQTIPAQYLLDLNKCYEDWISQYKESTLLVIEMSQLDFVNNEKDWLFILESIEQKMLETNSIKIHKF
ncbi:MAG: deoxynucleoside kinase [Cytophagales bacterium]|nr:MAG: deoxynucleoside kinase [Cytophagales bacterium]